MIPRSIQSELLKLLDFYPAVGLIGPRQVGKTTLALALKNLTNRPIQYFDLDKTEDYVRLSQEPGFFLSQYQEYLIIIDEVQRLPALFSELRSLIDKHRVPGRFLLLGSTSPLLMRNTSDSLAGRIAYLTLNPLSVSELNLSNSDLRKHWWRGGFPDAWLAPSDELSAHWRESFVRTYVERDLQFLGLQTDPLRFRSFLLMLAGTHGNLLNAESLGRSLGTSGNTIRHYLNFLESSFFVHILRPYHVNLGKRLVKSPKVYIRDSGLLHTLLGIHSEQSLVTHAQSGASWEGYALLQIIDALPSGWESYFFRTSDGTECDLILVKGLKPVCCIEIKLGNTPSLSKGFISTIQNLKTAHNFMITYDSETYLLKDNIRVIGLLDFVRRIPELFSEL